MKTGMSLLLMLCLCGCLGASSKNAIPKNDVSEGEYDQIAKRILDRVMALKTSFPSMSNMVSAASYEYNVTWVLDDPTKPHSKTNGRRELFGKNGYWFSLQFYRGQWGGAAKFMPIEFGDLKLWFQYGHGGNTKEIAAITTILREENEAFCKKHPWQKPSQILKATAPENKLENVNMVTRVGFLPTEEDQHPLIVGSVIPEGQQGYLDLFEGGKRTKQVIVVYPVKMKRPEEKNRQIEIKGHLHTFELEKPAQGLHKMTYENEAIEVREWKYKEEK